MSTNFSRRHFVGTSAAALTAAILIRPSIAKAAAFPVTHSDADWHRILDPKRYAVLRQAATEAPFSSPLLNEHRRGTFVCAGCAQPLFSSATKFESGTGWPSFWRPLAGADRLRPDHSDGMDRTEVLCARCGGHLGHVFDDGPKPTGQRYCMNGLAMQFRPA
ncbi:peptide-methionine (R)-S-oxide reductase MsrB [Sphingomonas sp.]|uniref:peptide-methionine (R)-S-oxide reductase MsrB n=1 Tax=Sphingomonas sp. TaxID=28214 RepID=UPI0025ED2185|nr:peptide-methionine (R)-S-oxide reductase MsrB [Sphingomonas sp.]MBV9527225.1 peptide-methionine (R)-S-oxide reductase MsrB [Sphingomonas sp.]